MSCMGYHRWVAWSINCWPKDWPNMDIIRSSTHPAYGNIQCAQYNLHPLSTKFCVKYGRWEHAEHLLAALIDHYNMMTDWKASLFSSIQLQWNYDKRMVILSMTGYVEAALHRFQLPWLACLEDLPYQHNIPQYGTKVQLTDPIDTSLHSLMTLTN